MKPLGVSQNQLARALAVDPARINRLVSGKCRLTADTALRLAAHFGTSAQFWLGLQLDYDLDTVSDAAADEISRVVKPHPRAESVCTPSP